jgi:hypothetical protein
MGLRDYFAGQALAGGVGQGDWFEGQDGDDEGWNLLPDLVAERAYAIADAMLAEKERRHGK